MDLSPLLLILQLLVVLLADCTTGLEGLSPFSFAFCFA
jgi:hypothetical protein